MIISHVPDEQNAFWCLVYIMGEHNWRDIFNEETPKLVKLLETVDEYINKKFPKLVKYLKNEVNFDLTSIFSSIFITLFVYDAP